MNEPSQPHAGAAAPTREAPAFARPWAWLVGRVSVISEHETSVVRRGFHVESAEVAERLEAIGRSFVWGYNHAVRTGNLDVLARELAKRPAADAGFAYEGAAMGIAVADWLTPGRHLLGAYIAGPAKAYEYLAWVGMGWAFARLPVSPMRALERHTGLNRWLALDGYGFHQGYFSWHHYIAEQRRPQHLPAQALRVFDQGLGRSLWFVKGASPCAIAAAIAPFDNERQEDLWSGVGLAAAYAGGATREALSELAARAGRSRPALSQGAVFAAEARRKAGHPAPATELACGELLALSLPDAASLAVQARPEGSSLSHYQDWRSAVQEHFRRLKGN